jgi:hypothetical protein
MLDFEPLQHDITASCVAAAPEHNVNHQFYSLAAARDLLPAFLPHVSYIQSMVLVVVVVVVVLAIITQSFPIESTTIYRYQELVRFQAMCNHSRTNQTLIQSTALKILSHDVFSFFVPNFQFDHTLCLRGIVLELEN